MKAAYDDHDLRLLLDGWVIPGQFDARDLAEAFRTAVAALVDEGVEYAVVGELALARYVRARFTDVIALRLLSSERTAQAQLLIEAATRLISATSTVRCNLNVVTSPIERAFVLDAPVVDWLGVRAALATPEYLLWLALWSRSPTTTSSPFICSSRATSIGLDSIGYVAVQTRASCGASRGCGGGRKAPKTQATHGASNSDLPPVLASSPRHRDEDVAG